MLPWRIDLKLALASSQGQQPYGYSTLSTLNLRRLLNVPQVNISLLFKHVNCEHAK